MKKMCSHIEVLAQRNNQNPCTAHPQLCRSGGILHIIFIVDCADCKLSAINSNTSKSSQSTWWTFSCFYHSKSYNLFHVFSDWRLATNLIVCCENIFFLPGPKETRIIYQVKTTWDCTRKARRSPQKECRRTEKSSFYARHNVDEWPEKVWQQRH